MSKTVATATVRTPVRFCECPRGGDELLYKGCTPTNKQNSCDSNNQDASPVLRMSEGARWNFFYNFNSGRGDSSNYYSSALLAGSFFMFSTDKVYTLFFSICFLNLSLLTFLCPQQTKPLFYHFLSARNTPFRLLFSSLSRQNFYFVISCLLVFLLSTCFSLSLADETSILPFPVCSLFSFPLAFLFPQQTKLPILSFFICYQHFKPLALSYFEQINCQFHQC